MHLPDAAPVPQLPALILDTNVVLDWLVFRDARWDSLWCSLESRQVKWVASPPMQSEFEQVIARPTLVRHIPDPQWLAAQWLRWVHPVNSAPDTPRSHPRCSDPDDQKFIDLGIHLRARALISRDRAVLRCARRARVLGLEILAPQEWVPG